MKFLLSSVILCAGLLGVAWAPATTEPESAGASCGRDEKAEYVGAESCKKCHFKQFTSWKKTPMAKTFDTLKPGNAAEAKKKFKLDEKKDYTKDATCLPCHTTGYDKPGGYPAVVEGKTWTDDEKKRAGERENVQCEACHGPGSLTNVYKKDNEKYVKAEILKRGMHAADEANCKTCHSDKAPTFDKEKKFDYAAFIKDAEKLHQHVELKNKH